MILIPLSSTFSVKAERIVSVMEDRVHKHKIYFVAHRDDAGDIQQFRATHTNILKLHFKENRIKIINETD